ncbi:MAG: hypothetical protein LBH48_02615 [Bifidobacteriaceae bacterium]|nr:hypothetical protein [Bifidobacteriaceae bacterium]
MPDATMQSKTHPLNSPVALKYLTQSQYMLAGLTLFWAGAMLAWALIDRPVPVWVAIIVFAALAGAVVWIVPQTVRCSRGIGRLPAEQTGVKDPAANKKWALIFSTEGIAIGLTAGTLSSFGLFSYIIPATLLIVGLHFIPIGVLYKTSIQQYWAAVLVVVAIVGIVLLIAGGTGATFANVLCALAGALSTSWLAVWGAKTVQQRLAAMGV